MTDFTQRDRKMDGEFNELLILKRSEDIFGMVFFLIAVFVKVSLRRTLSNYNSFGVFRMTRR